MFIPTAFRETDPEKMFDFIEQHSFGLLASEVEGEPFVTHLPILLDRDFSPHGRLIGHMARSNPQWQEADGKTVLAVFSGPHAYISPTWYAAENVVPTWNYTAVHAYGTFQAIHDSDELLEIVRDYVNHYEASLPQPWTLDIESEFVKKMAGAIVGFRIEITRLEGKWKLNQNHSQERREKVIGELRQFSDENSQAIAQLMEENMGR